MIISRNYIIKKLLKDKLSYKMKMKYYSYSFLNFSRSTLITLLNPGGEFKTKFCKENKDN
jgi:hypothetical protein